MIEIFPNLYVGDQQDYEASVRYQPGWWVVHACKEPYHRQALGYITRGAPKEHPEYLVARRDKRLILNLVDAPDPSFIRLEIIHSALSFIREALVSQARVLVHCNLGASRSAAIGLLYLMAYTDRLPTTSLDEAEAAYRAIYPPYDPGAGVRGFVAAHWREYVGWLR
ncbi:MAG: dual specificity protein phosphatase family protein [Anaerolineae bacterium]